MKLDMFLTTGRGYPVMRWAALALFASILVMTGIPAARATGDHAGDHSSEDDSSTTQLKSHKAQLQAELAQASGEPPALQKMVRDGVVVEFQVIPDKSVGKIQEGRLADVEFRISDAATGNPIKGIYPAVFIPRYGSTLPNHGSSATTRAARIPAASGCSFTCRAWWARVHWWT